MYCPPKLVLAAAAAWLATAAVVAQSPAELLAGAPKPDALDGGTTVELFESPNLDRFLRRARQFLDEEKYPEAIEVLQSVIEGRTLVASAGPGVAEDAGPGAGSKDTGSDTGGATGSDTGGGTGSGGEAAEDGTRLADPSQTVFSHDGRIYRPARRLCHEYLARMPAIGLQFYRTSYESKAQDLLDEALLTGRISSLEYIANNYFATIAAGKAMQVLADRHMHEGRYRAAVQVLRDLSDLYPEENLRRLSISRLWCQFKIALCLRLAGEVGAAIEAAQQLAASFPEESVRVMGELHSVRGLAEGPFFAAEDESMVANIGAGRAAGRAWLRATTEDLVPLWQYRFHGADPYASGKSGSEERSNGFFVSDGVAVNSAPYASKYGTGTRVSFVGDGYPAPRALFLENYRLRQADAFTGLLSREGDEPHQPPKPREGYPRSRVPAYDFALQRTVDDGERVYIVSGYNKTSQSLSALKVNEIIAYEQESLRRLWSSNDFLEGDDSYQEVTFLAAPTVFGERLLVPVLRRGAYMLQCLDRQTGRPLWRARLHAGGSEFFKAPGTPVLVMGSLAYVLTNAGAVAAVDAFAGDLKWIRRYERADPLRPLPVVRQQPRQQVRFRGGQVQFMEQNLPFFMPSEMFAAAGTVVFAGCDSRMLLCVDGATGEPLWMIDGTTRYSSYDELRYLIGTAGDHLFAASETHVISIGLLTGLVEWARPLPQASDRLTRWRGRGCVLDGFVVMPGDRELLVTGTDGQREWRRLQLPSFGMGDEPLRGPNNLFSAGPWLGVAYSNGVEVYSTAEALSELAAQEQRPLVRATYLVQSGDLRGGISNLETWLRGDIDAAAERVRGEEQLVALARELAMAQKQGVGILDQIEPLIATRAVRMQWFLARLEYFRQVQNLVAYGQEQQRLYRYMEGKD